MDIALRQNITNTEKLKSKFNKFSIEQNNIHSPISDLAFNLGELSTKHDAKTPRRRLSLCSSGTATPVAASRPRTLQTKLAELDQGCFVDSPSPEDTDSPPISLGLEQLDDLAKPNKCDDFPSQAFKRFQSMPVPFCGFTPSPPNSTAAETRACDRLSKYSPPEAWEDPASPLLQPRASRRQKVARFPARSPLKPLNMNVTNTTTTVTSPCKSSDSQDSGVGLDSKDSEFKLPVCPAPRSVRVHSDESQMPHSVRVHSDESQMPHSVRVHSDESQMPHKFSPVSKKAPRTFKGVTKALSGGIFHKRSPQKSASDRSNSVDSDDGIDLLDSLDAAGANDAQEQSGVPQGMASLLHSRLLDQQPTPKLRWQNLEDQENIKPSAQGIRRGLFRSPSAPRLLQHKSHTLAAPPTVLSPTTASPILVRGSTQTKRAPCDEEELTPRICKRRKSVTQHCSNSQSSLLNSSGDAATSNTLHIPRPDFNRCQSESEAMIKHALNRQASCPDLVGDMSRSHCLPLCPSKHQDLKAILPEALAAVLRGEFDDVVEKCIIVDSRYPYEFDGGHIKGAKNLYTRDQIMEEFFNKSEHLLTREINKRTIIVFHCEFSSERGPKMSRFLRSTDRARNKELYPFLNYPEVYLLENGYKRFFEEQKPLCEPQTYKPMLHEGHEEDLKQFRAKSKSWAGGVAGGGRPFRSVMRSGLKF